MRSKLLYLDDFLTLLSSSKVERSFTTWSWLESLALMPPVFFWTRLENTCPLGRYRFGRIPMRAYFNPFCSFTKLLDSSFFWKIFESSIESSIYTISSLVAEKDYIWVESIFACSFWDLSLFYLASRCLFR